MLFLKKRKINIFRDKLYNIYKHIMSSRKLKRITSELKELENQLMY